MNMRWIPLVLIAVAVSSSALAHGSRDYGDDHRYRRHERVVVQQVYHEPVVIYRQAPVVYRERVIYQERPVYSNYERRDRDYERSSSHSDNSQRLVGQTIGAIAGAALGSQVGRGNGRVAATAIGAVMGAVVGGSVAR